MAHVARQHHTFSQYVEIEKLSPIKHEYLEGHVWAMAGGTPSHAAIAAKVSSLLIEQLRGKPCRVFSSDLRIRVPATGLSTYPDVSVICDSIELAPDDHTKTTAINPTVVVEVLSPSTEAYDRGEKLDHYKQLASLREVVLVAHDAERLHVFRRHDDTWHEDVIEAGSTAALESISVELPLDEIYDDPLS